MLCGTGWFSASLVRTSAAQLLSLQRHTLQIRIGKHTFIRKNAKLVHGQTIKLMLSNVGVSDFLILPIKLLLIHALNCFYCHVCVKMIYGDHLTKDLLIIKHPKQKKNIHHYESQYHTEGSIGSAIFYLHFIYLIEGTTLMCYVFM